MHPIQNTRRLFQPRTLPGWGLLGLALILPSGVRAQSRFTIVGEEQSWASPGGTSSAYIAAQALPGPTRPVVMAGNFEQLVIFPPGSLPFLSGTAGVPAVFAGVLDYDSSDARWEVGVFPQQVDKLEPRNPVAASSPSAELLDLAVVDRNEYYVTGIVDDATYFENRDATNFTVVAALPIPPVRGFVALADSGTFTSVHHTDATIQPKALSTDVAGSFLVIAGQERDTLAAGYDGADAQVHRYSLPLPASGTPLSAAVSISDPKLNATALSEVAVSSSGETWVGGTKAGTGFLGGVSDIWLGRADFTGDQILDDFRAGSEGVDRLFAMERGEHGEIYVAFTVGGRDVAFGGLTYDLDAAPFTAAVSTHAFVGMIKSDGTPGWLSPLGFSQTAGGNLKPSDLSVDAGGNVFVTVNGAGDWRIEGLLEVLSGPGQITLNGKGRVVDFSETPALGTANAGAVPDLENRLVLGQTGVQSAFSTLEALAVNQSSQFIRWTNPTLPGNTVEALSALITSFGGQVHDELDYPAYGTVGVSAWLTPNQIRALNDGYGGVMMIMADPLIISTDEGGFGEVADPGWALARLFDPYLVDPEAPGESYYFSSGHVTGDPAGPKKVRVYVIDKGLGEIEPFVFQDLAGQGGLPIEFDGAGGLNVDSLVHPVQDGESVPDTSSNHPRQVVNLLAAANLGAAEGTAMEIISGDMYSGASPEMGNSLTYASYVSHAILECLSDAVVRDLGEELPTLLVIASSGEDPLDQVDIGGAIDQALLQGVTVIISAGNGGPLAEAEDFVPAQHGDKNGVITVGATSFAANPAPDASLGDLNPPYSNGNVDSTHNVISLYAPGGSVDTGYGAASGTSFSCALVAGLAVNYLTFHPEATPAEVEQALVQMSVYDGVGQRHIARSACVFGAWLYRHGLGEVASGASIDFETDSDEDGDSDFFEFLGRSDPTDDRSRAQVPVDFTLAGKSASISAWLPASLPADGKILADGCWSLPVGLEIGDNLSEWLKVEPDQVVNGPVSGGLRELRFEIDLEPYFDDRCFLRFDFGLPASP
ncbi:S8 family serine peptidase [Luteolibacter marinus]|uniref:S8 family serine peptidase n=1 Tax=Luteolibacter marinus TaxID=2776705 RepID=UPI001865D5C7